jgi:iron complex transport system substrate-binding protein
MTARACKYSSLAVALCASVLALQGCGSTGSGKAAVVKGKVSSKVAEVAGAGFPVSVGTPFGPVTLQRRPERVVSLSPTATEMLFAIGAGRQVVAVDNDSDYPPNAPRTKLSGYTPNVEAIAGYKPDLVVISYNPTPPNLVASLKVLHIPALYLPAAADLSQTYAELTELGKLTG